MIDMRRRINLVALFFLLIASCSDREYPFADLNVPDDFEIVSLNGWQPYKIVEGEYWDSLKTTVFSEYKMKIMVNTDNNNNILHFSNKAGFEVFKTTDEYVTMEANSFYVEPGDNDFTCNFEGSGFLSANIYLKDGFTEVYSKTFYVSLFENLTPHVKITGLINSTNVMTYDIDASQSYDRDAKYGGEIISYQYVVDGGEPIITVQSSYSHTFATNGSHVIEVSVKDNDEVWSVVEAIVFTL